ncbi:hypothetical protein HPC62_17140 [Thermoleptolyngbya sichuanensis A183]|uniref:Uncharacterized protein n=1 Tax=Thermoleptolyngbya sichuanensis A183 TaxID=2737172 RepID=A0A6M8BHP2_9CYAN|nr:hypothetical protein [Thermoleptolyngbya sichuanensis]QKD83690.1 hypothetical protein HPC62_17140 [Thermoleptolyngbya sichuanensis A183]
MLTEHRQPVCLSWMSLNSPLWSVVEASAALYEKEPGRYHVVLTEPLFMDYSQGETSADQAQQPHLLWLEISPYRVIMTMQGNGSISYRHFWEQGVYGISRYWLRSQSGDLGMSDQMRLRNYTRHLKLISDPQPRHLRVEYELWTENLQLGHYVLNLEMQSL